MYDPNCNSSTHSFPLFPSTTLCPTLLFSVFFYLALLLYSPHLPSSFSFSHLHGKVVPFHSPCRIPIILSSIEVPHAFCLSLSITPWFLTAMNTEDNIVTGYGVVNLDLISYIIMFSMAYHPRCKVLQVLYGFSHYTKVSPRKKYSCGHFISVLLSLNTEDNVVIIKYQLCIVDKRIGW